MQLEAGLRMRAGGIVLCGGHSARMGRPKAWLPVGGEVLLQRVVRLLGEAVSPVVVVAAPGQPVPPLPSAVEVVRDDEEGRGPLAGLAAGLAALGGRADAAFAAACDAPFLLPAVVRRVAALLDGSDALAAVPRAGGRLHPLAAAYRLSVRDTALSLLAAGRPRLTGLFDVIPTRVVEPHELADLDPGLRSLRNLNTPAEYEEALKHLAAPG